MIRASLVALALASCKPEPAPSSPPAVEDEPASTEVVEDTPEDAPEAAPTCARAPGWRYERIELPPEFAPSLPAGVETLWFAPGMFDPSAPDYFTYAFSLDWAEEQSPDAAALQTMLTDYFVGLMTAVAGSARSVAPANPATVEVEADGTRATVVMSDEFTQTADVQLTILISGDAGCMRLHATAKPTEDNFAALAEADACLCP